MHPSALSKQSVETKGSSRPTSLFKYGDSLQCAPYRCHPWRSKSLSFPEHQKENSREFETAEQHASTSTSIVPARLAPLRASTRRRAGRPPATPADRATSSISNIDLDYGAPVSGWEQVTPGDLISDWLAGIDPSDLDKDTLTDLNQEFANGSRLVRGLPLRETGRHAQLRAERNRSTRSGTGFDGPKSAISDAVLTTSPKLSGNSKSSAHDERFSKTSQRLRGHDVSEVSIPDPVSPTYPVIKFSLVTSKDGSEGEDDDASVPYFGPDKPPMRLYNLQDCASQSCPELWTRPENLMGSMHEGKVDGSQELIAPNYSQVHKDTAWHRFHTNNSLTKRFRSIGRRLRTSTSSSYSIRSDFPAPPNARERRFLTRESSEVYPSSDNETPMYNTPESDLTPFVHPHPSNGDPLAEAGMMSITAELDRLSSMGSQDQRAKVSTSSLPRTPMSSGFASPSSAVSVAGSGTHVSSDVRGHSAPSSGPPSTHTGPVSRPPQRAGQRRRGQRSHLSEVTTPEDLPPPTDFGIEAGRTPQPFKPSTFETLYERSPDIDRSKRHGHSCPEPLSLDRAEHEITQPPMETEDVPQDPPPTTSTSKIVTPIPVRNSAGLLQPVSPPSRMSSIGKTPESMYGPTVDATRPPAVNVVYPTLGSRPALASSRSSPGPRRRSRSAADHVDPAEPKPVNEPGSVHESPEALDHLMQCVGGEPGTQPDLSTSPTSCHPNTWSESSGEPGDSDPFCPEHCLDSRPSGQNLRRLKDCSSWSTGTVRILKPGDASCSDAREEKGKGGANEKKV
ncbi:hypothetical protein F4778DRAFT_802204 [Xylariomycetidae sp. FL2044]|nr:hypothetical protein F4778DRAFT_802204 [Xylariomycetidae sp. FL2044]